jgi:hypothetical protein
MRILAVITDETVADGPEPAADHKESPTEPAKEDKPAPEHPEAATEPC